MFLLLLTTPGTSTTPSFTWNFGEGDVLGSGLSNLVLVRATAYVNFASGGARSMARVPILGGPQLATTAPSEIMMIPRPGCAPRPGGAAEPCSLLS